ncbi:uncharacterized protein LOC132050971 [Lycium ferocissimum]|uniref:uncharacterized protein LOC132050971 n=1 Tax=Lycium ferocissimum TaxID=112874 RepID=UPI002815CFCC|nr:uncharacterized protein LOC132050971 [Lycium ferocissimum]
MISNCSEFHVHHQKSFRIKHEDTTKFFSKLLSKENTNKLAIPSFRIYYGDNVPSSVPFIWESQPGTPKHTLSQTSHYLPPLTPPPSYYKNNDINQKPTRKNSRSKLFHALIKKLINPKKPHFPLSPSSSSSSSISSSLSWSSSSHSSFSAPTTPLSKCGGYQAGVFMMKKALFSDLSGRRSS